MGFQNGGLLPTIICNSPFAIWAFVSVSGWPAREKAWINASRSGPAGSSVICNPIAISHTEKYCVSRPASFRAWSISSRKIVASGSRPTKLSHTLNFLSRRTATKTRLCVGVIRRQAICWRRRSCSRRAWAASFSKPAARSFALAAASLALAASLLASDARASRAMVLSSALRSQTPSDQNWTTVNVTVASAATAVMTPKPMMPFHERSYHQSAYSGDGSHDIDARTFQLGVFLWVMGGIMAALVIVVPIGMYCIRRQERQRRARVSDT